MPSADNDNLIAAAVSGLNPHPVGRRLVGHVGCAMVTAKGDHFSGVCIDTGSGTGFCAEVAAIAAMVTAGQYEIAKIVAVWRGEDGALYVLRPCGRCREFIRQIDGANLRTEVVLGPDATVTLQDLLPQHEWPEPVGPLLTVD